MTRFLILLAALLVAAPVPTLRADGFLGLFGKKKQEKVMPAQAELDRREGEARALAAEAAAAAAAGNPAKAAKINLGVAKDYPLSSVAATSLFEAGRLYEQAGEPGKAFEAYQEFLTRFKGDRRYQAALDRQFALAMDCKDGKHAGKFLGMRIGGVSKADAVTMLEAFIANAPRSRQAAQARIAIGEYQQKQGKVLEAVASYQKAADDYPNTPESAEAQYRVGQVYLARAEQKSKDRTTISSAREAFEDYLVRNPAGFRSGEVRSRLQSIGSKEARETFEIARFYEKTHKLQAAAIYYREVLRMNVPDLSVQARERLDALGATGVNAPQLPDEDFLAPMEPLTKERDDYVGPLLPDQGPRLPSLRYNEPETLPGGEPAPPPTDSALLEDVPAGTGGTPPPDAPDKPAEAPDKAPAPGS